MAIRKLQSSVTFTIRHPDLGFFLSVMNVTTESLIVSQTLRSFQSQNLYWLQFSHIGNGPYILSSSIVFFFCWIWKYCVTASHRVLLKVPKQQFVIKSSTDSTSSLKRQRHDHNGCDVDEKQFHRNAETKCFSKWIFSFCLSVFLMYFYLQPMNTILSQIAEVFL